MSTQATSLSETASRLREAYLESLLSGDVRRARALVDGALHGGMTVADLYLEVFQEALYEVGRLWQSGLVTVAQEHLATATTQAIMARVWPQSAAADGRPRRAITTTTARELHVLGARFLSDFLEAAGWTVIELGASTPARDLAGLARQLAPELVCLSTTMAHNLGAAQAAIAELRTLDPVPLIAVGGQAYNGDEAMATALGADIFAGDARAFIERLEAAFGRSAGG